MISRREFFQVAAATAAIGPGATSGRAIAQQKLTQADLLAFEPLGNVTLVHLTDLHAQLRPLYFREPSINIGVGEARGHVPHLTGANYLRRFGIARGSAAAYAMSDENFEALAKTYGRVGGLDRIATIVAAIRAERGDKVALLDGGDTWQGSWTALATKGRDVIDCMALLKPDAMTGHWEFTYGTDRVKEAVAALGFPFLALNLRDSEWNERVFDPIVMIERGGVKIAVLGQAFPYTPIANPRWMIPDWSFGIREEEVQAEVDGARAAGAALVVLLSHNGFDVDRKMAHRVRGVDVILSGHTHDAAPEPILVGKTLIVASGSSGKFVSRLDLDVRGGEVKAYRHKLIPVLSDVIAPDGAMAAEIEHVRKPYAADLARVLGVTESTLYRRGNFNGTFDDLLCNAILQERDAEIALSPGFRWGASLLPGQNITFEDVTNVTAITYPNVYRSAMTGAQLKAVLEDVADNLFNADPYYQQGGDMVRVGGLSYTIDVTKERSRRISNMALTRTGAAIEPSRDYQVAGWASVNQNVEGPPIWDVVSEYLATTGTVKLEQNRAVEVIGA
ncbi:MULTISPECIES: thiosulfohydrolase SoxB [Methylosinus]|uniref:Thiosulfohydrolase SoxB n=1 Tax=Methylosinus trichosporium (strain ATCC 35070 / NCIMB 11131 / UNIQEM 75 / OB3b) TaxID=595536 RepID=A0A2D2D6J7_METT3|nr:MULTISPECIES: thiosulfohydrolase SoxB [Methylosinus]ATQ70593.1 thiosulfohydrolase SoxB [Methylosinus trichosporium OB3b]OBS51052.1 thiosulfohydrolase SoxB [Methylosinus sp. 3S-1]